MCADHPHLIWPIVLVGFIGTFGFNFPIWLTAFTDKVFHGGRRHVRPAQHPDGRRLASRARCSSARRGTSRMRLMVGAALLFGVLETVAALSPSFWLFAALMAPDRDHAA